MKQQLHLDKIGSLCTDGAPVMLGNHSGFTALLKKEISSLKITHCFLDRHAFAAKTFPFKLKKTLEICVKVVNTICCRALNQRLFKLFCKELGEEQTVLIYYTEVRSCHLVVCYLVYLNCEMKLKSFSAKWEMKRWNILKTLN